MRGMINNILKRLDLIAKASQDGTTVAKSGIGCLFVFEPTKSGRPKHTGQAY